MYSVRTPREARRFLRNSNEVFEDAESLGATKHTARRCRKPCGATAPSSMPLLETTTSEPYKYQPLDRTRREIRLLTLQPGSGDEMLCCTLEHAFLDSSPPPLYETISYVCGDQNRKSEIILHGHQVQVLETSEAALRRMRLEDRPRTLWIDSICIDQANLDERGHQVGMMYEIYTKTARNLIWMGPYDNTWAKAFDTMRAILQEIAIETRDYAHFQELLYSREEGDRFSEKPLAIDMHTDGSKFLCLFDDPWFSRLWVVQEAALAPSSVCCFGRFGIPLLDVLRSARWLFYKWFHLPKMSVSTQRGLENAVSIANAADSEYGFFHTTKYPILGNCLVEFGRHHTFDRKDYVFAILGLWQMFTKSTTLPDALKPDYTLTVCEVFTKATRFAVEEANVLWILEMISEPPREAQGVGWPSWVPVLDQVFGQDDQAWPFSGTFNAHNSTPAIITNDPKRSNDLVVSGILIDSVNMVTPAFTARMTVSDLQSAIGNLERTRGSSWVRDEVEGLERKMSLVLAGGALLLTRATGEDVLSQYQIFKGYVEEHGEYPSETHTPAGEYWTALRDAAWERRVFHTRDGYIGLGPKCCQPGDVVAILYGCSFPMVMRPLPEPGSFRLLGTSYVYGIMEGEAVQEHKDRGGDDTVFRIV